MIAEEPFWPIQAGSPPTTSAKRGLLASLQSREYRTIFVGERLRSSVALQIRALREQRNRMTQQELGERLGMAQTWISRLESPEYGKMTVATLLRLAEAFDVDLEVKFRPFSQTIKALTAQAPDYFAVPSFDEELSRIEKSLALEENVALYGKGAVNIILGTEPRNSPYSVSANVIQDESVRALLEPLPPPNTATIIFVENASTGARVITSPPIDNLGWTERNQTPPAKPLSFIGSDCTPPYSNINP
jgi:transcriptional regulator with XRE-family HTH domain